MSDTPPPLTKKTIIKRIAPLQLGKVLAVLYGIMGLIFIPFFTIVSSMASAHSPAEQPGSMLGFGVGLGLFMPVLYAVMGFVTGVLGSAIYNRIAKWIGGIEVEIE